MDRQTFDRMIEDQKTLQSAVRRASDLYNSLLKENELPVGDNDIWHSDDTARFEDGEVLVDWSVTWAYGGYDCGTCHIPLDAIFDGTFDDFIRSKVINMVRERDEKRRKAKRSAAAKKAANKRKRRNQLIAEGWTPPPNQP